MATHKAINPQAVRSLASMAAYGWVAGWSHLSSSALLAKPTRWPTHCPPILAVFASPLLGGAHQNPVGRRVTRPRKAPAFHKGLQPIQPVPVLRLPVGCDASADQAQHMTGQTRHAHPRQDEKPGVVGDPVQCPWRCGGLPAQKTIPHRALPRRRPKQKTSQILALGIADQVTEVLAHPAQSQVVKAVQIKRPSLRRPAGRLDHRHLQRLQFAQPGLPHGRTGPVRQGPARLPWAPLAFLQRGQPDLSSGFQLEQQTARREVLGLTATVPPIPLLAQPFGQLLAAPVPPGFHPASELFNIGLAQPAPLNTSFAFHRRSSPQLHLVVRHFLQQLGDAPPSS